MYFLQASNHYTQYQQCLGPTCETLRDPPQKKIVIISFKIRMEIEYHNNEYSLGCLYTYNIVIKYGLPL